MGRVWGRSGEERDERVSLIHGWMEKGVVQGGCETWCVMAGPDVLWLVESGSGV